MPSRSVIVPVGVRPSPVAATSTVKATRVPYVGAASLATTATVASDFVPAMTNGESVSVTPQSVVPSFETVTSFQAPPA